MADDFSFLNGGGKMGALIRTRDWPSTPLGSVDTWPQSLRTAVGIVIASKFPACLVWGPHLITIYNDAFRPILGAKPEALGEVRRHVILLKKPFRSREFSAALDAALTETPGRTGTGDAVRPDHSHR